MSQTAKVSVMAAVITACLIAAVATHRSEVLAGQQGTRGIYEAVNRQFEAIRGADFHEAYRQASSHLQNRQTLEEFKAMARAEFLPLASAQRIELGPVHAARTGHAVVQVFLISHSGVVTPCVFDMVREQSGWRVQTVNILPHWPRNHRMGGTRA